MLYKTFSEPIASYVRSLFQINAHEKLFYHNLLHTEQVVARSMEIAEHTNINEVERFILFAAAWFHDVGHLFTGIPEHEEESTKVMEHYFSYFPVNSAVKKAISFCILATKGSVQPQSHLEEIIRDADTYHFGTSGFKITDVAIKKELEARSGKTFTGWHQSSLNLLLAHQFYTNYCRSRLQEGKEENIRYLSELIEKGN